MPKGLVSENLKSNAVFFLSQTDGEEEGEKQAKGPEVVPNISDDDSDEGVNRDDGDQ